MTSLPARRSRIGAFNGFVLAGAAVNVAVVLVLVIHWLLS